MRTPCALASERARGLQAALEQSGITAETYVMLVVSMMRAGIACLLASLPALLPRNCLAFVYPSARPPITGAPAGTVGGYGGCTCCGARLHHFVRARPRAAWKLPPPPFPAPTKCSPRCNVMQRAAWPCMHGFGPAPCSCSCLRPLCAALRHALHSVQVVELDVVEFDHHDDAFWEHAAATCMVQRLPAGSCRPARQRFGRPRTCRQTHASCLLPFGTLLRPWVHHHK